MSSTMGQPVVHVVGARVALGPLVREHVPLYARWRNDFAVTRTVDTPVLRTIEALTAMYAGQAQAGDAYLFTIYERAGWRPIGRTILYDVDWQTSPRPL